MFVMLVFQILACYLNCSFFFFQLIQRATRVSNLDGSLEGCLPTCQCRADDYAVFPRWCLPCFQPCHQLFLENYTKTLPGSAQPSPAFCSANSLSEAMFLGSHFSSLDSDPWLWLWHIQSPALFFSHDRTAGLWGLLCFIWALNLGNTENT